MDHAPSYREHMRAILALGLPLIGSQIAQFAIHMTDTLMLGWYDVRALAAVTLASSYWFVLFITGAGFGLAVAPMVAAAQARGDMTRARRVTRMGLHASIAYGALVLPLMLWAAPVLGALGQEAQIALLAESYLRIAAWGIFPALGVMVLKNYLAAMENTRMILMVTLSAVAMNALMNYALIFGHWGAPELGVRGAAIASVIVNAASFLALALHASRSFPEHALFTRFLRPDPEALRDIFRLGWPIGLTNLAETGLFTASAVMVGWLGTEALAAHGIALQAAALAFMVHVGLSNVATVRAGNAIGRGDIRRLGDGAKVVITLSLGFSLIVIALFIALPEQIISLFLDPGDPARPAVIAIGRKLLIVAAIFQLADAMQVLALGLLRGVGDTRMPMLIATLAYWVLGLGTGYGLGIVAGLGAVGVWLGLVVGLAVAGGLLMWRFWYLVAQRERQATASA